MTRECSKTDEFAAIGVRPTLTTEAYEQRGVNEHEQDDAEYEYVAPAPNRLARRAAFIGGGAVVLGLGIPGALWVMSRLRKAPEPPARQVARPYARR